MSLFLVQCTLLEEHICPTGNDRFTPDMDPTDVMAGGGSGPVLCPDGQYHDFEGTEGGPTYVLVLCSERWCVDEYEGYFCVTKTLLMGWADDCDCGYMEGNGGYYFLDCDRPTK